MGKLIRCINDKLPPLWKYSALTTDEIYEVVREDETRFYIRDYKVENIEQVAGWKKERFVILE
jgi:hypothetical protein